jgi:hypothetical protein
LIFGKIRGCFVQLGPSAGLIRRPGAGRDGAMLLMCSTPPKVLLAVEEYSFYFDNKHQCHKAAPGKLIFLH